MNTRVVLAASAIMLGLLGVTSSFLPQELLHHFDQPLSDINVLAVKLLGTFYLSFAILNWMSKERLMGGIYNRPLALSNTLHFSITSITLVKYLINYGASNKSIIILTIIYSVFALAFIKIIFTTPKQVSSPK